jgi:hypothetical protein
MIKGLTCFKSQIKPFNAYGCYRVFQKDDLFVGKNQKAQKKEALR